MENYISSFRSDSIIEKMIKDNSFAYHQPWFYNHTYALRCELGVGKSTLIYFKNAKKRAYEIFDLLFPCPPDAIFFDHYIQDYSSTDIINTNQTLKYLKKDLTFLANHLDKYDSTVVFNIPLCENEAENYIQKNRVICYTDNKYPYKKRITENFPWMSKNVHFVSFENECILSIYDNRGCDIVFATKEKMREFYHKLKPYLLEYDMEEIKKRIGE